MRGDVKRIDRLITDISDASRPGCGTVARSAPTRGAVQAARHHCRNLPHDGDTAQAVEFVLRDELPAGAIVRGRDERLGQVFRNLIDNAMSFSPAGGKVIVTALAPGRWWRALWWRTKGRGIPPDNLESIFERFLHRAAGAKPSGRIPAWGFPSRARSLESTGGRI